MDVRRRLGLNLKKPREEQGFSQESADHCGLYRTYISGIERGVRNPTVPILDKIAKALKVPAGALLDDARIPAILRLTFCRNQISHCLARNQPLDWTTNTISCQAMLSA